MKLKLLMVFMGVFVVVQSESYATMVPVEGDYFWQNVHLINHFFGTDCIDPGRFRPLTFRPAHRSGTASPSTFAGPSELTCHVTGYRHDGRFRLRVYGESEHHLMTRSFLHEGDCTPCTEVTEPGIIILLGLGLGGLWFLIGKKWLE